MDQVAHCVVWVLLLYFLQLTSYPFISRIFENKSSAYAFSKSFSLLLFAYPVWLIGLSTSFETIYIALSGLIILSILPVYFLKQDTLYPNLQEIVKIESLFNFSFLIYLLSYSFHPEIYWGEKPMDFTFLNYFTRLNFLPPTDPWASGNNLGYYYFGDFLFSLFVKLSGIKSSLGYAFGLATVFATLVVSFYAVSREFVESTYSLIIALLIVLLGNYDGIYLLFFGKNHIGFDYYWATSRTLTSPGMNEYPLWSFLFQDFHAHLINIPFVIATIYCLCIITKKLLARDFENIFILTIILSFLWGTCVFTNTWDYITLGTIIGGTFITLTIRSFKASYKARLLPILIFVFSIFLSTVFSVPFHLTVSSGTHASWGYVYPEEFNTFSEMFRIHGHWLLIAGISSLVIILNYFNTSELRLNNTSRLGSGLLSIILTLIPLGISFFCYIYGHVSGISIEVIIFATITMLCGTALLISQQLFFLGCLICGSSFLISISECFFLIDRMNTTFKANNMIWPIFGLGSLTAIFYLIQNSSNRVISHSLKALLTLVILPSVCASILCIYSMVTFERVASIRPTLDGTKYLELFNPSEKSGFDWINANVTGTPTIAEAFGPSYQEYSRVSMHTGLPSILGWEYHVQQRGSKDTAERKADLLTLYTSLDIHKRMQVLNKYNAGLIIVGRQERAAYGTAVEEEFLKHSEYFKLVFSNKIGTNRFLIFTHKYSKLQL